MDRTFQNIKLAQPIYTHKILVFFIQQENITEITLPPEN